MFVHGHLMANTLTLNITENFFFYQRLKNGFITVFFYVCHDWKGLLPPQFLTISNLVWLCKWPINSAALKFGEHDLYSGSQVKRKTSVSTSFSCFVFCSFVFFSVGQNPGLMMIKFAKHLNRLAVKPHTHFMYYSRDVPCPLISWDEWDFN